jgi:ATPase subunit of ABC transporter with duplicated ATPase domains
MPIRVFLESQGLDDETVEYVFSAYNDGSVEDLKEAASIFLSGEATDSLMQLVAAEKSGHAASTNSMIAKPLVLGSAFLGDDMAEVVGPELVAEKPSKPSKQARRNARAQEKSKAKAKVIAKNEGEVTRSEESRALGDVAAFGLKETEDGLDAFDSFAITGKPHRERIKHAAKFKDIVLPDVFVGIVTDLGQKDLIWGASLQVMRGHKYGLVGRNGCGKTTLLRRLARKQLPGLPPLRYGYVAQELVGTTDSVLDVACRGDTEFQEFLAERAHIEKSLMSGIESAELTEDFAAVMQRLDEIEESFGQHGLRGHARSILLGLQFTEEMLEMPTKALSGGWRMRLALAQALLSRADCLLLDEPTNHLDLAGVLWLQNFLMHKLDPDVMLVMISHDRVFLDCVVTDIIEIRRQNIEQGPGNFSAWQQRRAQQQEAISSKIEANEKERKRTKEMIQKMRDTASSSSSKREADPNKLRQAKQRQTQLYGKVGANGEEKTYGRLELVNYNGKVCEVKALAEELVADEKMKIRLPEAGQLSGILLALDGASFTITEANRTILRNVKLSLEPQSRVAVVGTNGAGKTTLLRWLEGAQWPQDSKARRHPKLKVAHVSQHHLERLEDHLTETCLDYLRSVLPNLEPGSDPNTILSNVASETLLHGYLANYGLGGIAKQKLGTLSGGQKARLAFAAEVWHKPHLLLLDEPTNHLDVETLDALSDALRTFQGATVIVSHNQGFLTEVCNELWTVDAGKVSCSGRGSENFSKEFSAYRRKVLRQIKSCS